MTELLLVRVQIWSLRNRFLARLRRLRQVKYLLPALVGIGYIAMVMRPWHTGFWQGLLGAGKMRAAGSLEAAEVIAAAVVTVILLAAWVWPQGRPSLQFSEAEIAFLFTAPLSRRQVIHYGLIKSQIGILFGALIVVLVGLRHVTPSWPFTLAAVWALFTFTHLYYMGVTIVRSSLLAHGVGGLRRAWPALAVLAIVASAIGVSAGTGALRLPGPDDAGDLARYVTGMGESFPLSVILMPARLLVRPAMASGLLPFLASLVPMLAVLAGAYLWVVRSDFRYEEASAELAARRAAQRSARMRGERRYERVAARSRRTPFHLAPTGPPAVAVLWKNLLATWRITGVFWLIWVAAALALAAPVAAYALRGTAFLHLPMIIAIQLLATAGVFTLVGSELVRTDLRADLLHVDLLRSYPVTGPALVAAEVAAPALVITLLDALLIAAALPMLDGVKGVSLAGWIWAASGAVVLLAALNLLLAVIHNAALILLPSWHHLGAGKARGVDAFGQVLIGMIVRVLALAFAVLPAAILGAGTLYLTFPRLGFAASPLVALAAAAPLAVEAWLGIGAVGLLFERFDPSRELDVAT